MSEVKFTKEEMAKVKTLQDDFNSVILQLGQLNVEEMNIASASKKAQEARKKIEENYELLTQREKMLALELNQKYGAGILDPKTGVFSPSSQ